MSTQEFQQQLQAYADWRAHLGQAVVRYRDWLDRYGLNDPDTGESILHLLEALRNDRITLAFAAEFSRGKTELINALFFSQAGVRLLPSSPGRTTMCPTELFYDEAGGSYIRLLAIESRLDSTPLSEYKNDPQSWMQIDLDPGSPRQMQEAFQELIATKKVGLEEAKKLGLFHEQLHGGMEDGEVEIPCWRHAQISFPHDLLREGLAILDTPGLNALGTEPELTMNMLPSAQAVIFVLAADTGVTKSDMDMWTHHVRGTRAAPRQGLAVVMNKIDTLWDDLGGEEDIAHSIRNQVRTTATTLEIDERVIFPVSAKQALLAKVKSDHGLLERSQLKELEGYLSDVVLKDRRQLLVNAVVGDLGLLLNTSTVHVNSSLDTVSRQLDELHRLGGDNVDLTQKLMAETRDQQTRYLANVENFQASRRVFSVQARLLIDALSPEKVEEILKSKRKEMIGSLTTFGMKDAMKLVFDELGELLNQAVELTEDTRRLVRAIYKKFQDEHGFEEITPQLFSIKKYQFELEQLFEEGEAFRNSASATLMEQGLVVQKLYTSIVFRARDLLLKCHKDASVWSTIVMNPLLQQIKDHKKMIETRLEMLRKINSSQESVEQNVKELEQQLLPIRQQLQELDEIKSAMGFQPGEMFTSADLGLDEIQEREAMAVSS